MYTGGLCVEMSGAGRFFVVLAWDCVSGALGLWWLGLCCSRGLWLGAGELSIIFLVLRQQMTSTLFAESTFGGGVERLL